MLKTIDDFLTVIKSDADIQELIANNADLKRDYKPRTRKGRSKNRSTKAGIALKYFWSSIDGVKLMYILESKYKINVSDNRLIGKVKQVLLIHLFKEIGQ